MGKPLFRAEQFLKAIPGSGGIMMLKRHIHWDKVMLCLTVLWLN